MLITERAAITQLRAVLKEVDIDYVESPTWGSAPTELHFTDGPPLTVQLDFLKTAGPARIKRWLYETRDVPVDYMILAAPWLSDETIKLCAEANRGALDLTGNYRLKLRHYHLERLGHAPPAPVQRDAQLLLSGKALQVVRAMLASPYTTWTVQRLAIAAQVSLGHASTVRRRLIRHGLMPPPGHDATPLDATLLLQRWAELGAQRAGGTQVISAYSLVQGTRLTQVLKNLPEPGQHVLLAASSAAEWMSPYLQDSRTHFVVDPFGYEDLQQHLKPQETARGANLTIEVTEDRGVFLDRFEPAADVWTTSPTQTYTDLFRQGNRGRQAAEKLLGGYLKPLWHGKQNYISWPLRDSEMRYD